MSDNLLYVGGGAGLVGIIIGYMIGGTDEEKLAAEIGAHLDTGTETAAPASAEQMAQMAETVSALGTQITGLQEQLSINAKQQAAAETAAAEKMETAVTALDARISAVSAELGKMVSSSGAEQTAKIEAALAGGMADLKGSLETLAAAAPAVAAVAAGSGEETAEPEPEVEGTRVGQTEVLMDGAVRVFVSGVDAQAGIVRVAVNGTATQMLGDWHRVAFTADGKDCLLQLDDIVQRHVQMSVSCAE